MLRHLLVALFLIGLSLPAVSAPAHAESAPVDCHGARPSGHTPDGDAAKAASHFCIGCVAPPSLPVAKAPPPLPLQRPIAQPMAALAGADTPPSPPPPRA